MSETFVLVGSAFSIGCGHTLMGPDHYLPFIATSKANGWSVAKTLRVTAMCGLGHVAGSVVLGIVGLILGTYIGRLEWIESIRGDMAAWSLIAFGAGYIVWAMMRSEGQSSLKPSGKHARLDDPSVHSNEASSAMAGKVASPRRPIPWLQCILLYLFVLGPCEPLIPLLMYPAASADAFAQKLINLAAVLVTFGAATIATMTVCVAAASLPIAKRFRPSPRAMHLLCGTTILTCGLLIQWGL